MLSTELTDELRELLIDCNRRNIIGSQDIRDELAKHGYNVGCVLPHFVHLSF